jgi:hypothetical protein
LRELTAAGEMTAERYQRLASEYTKIRAQNAILKKAVIDVRFRR